MARVNRPDIKGWYEVAGQWVNAALIKGDSLFTPGKAVWILENLNDLWDRYAENYKAGKGDFYEKLSSQLADAKPETRQLMGEVLYFYYLPMSGKVKATTKREAVEWVLGGVTPPVILSDDLITALQAGIARESQAYVQQRYYQIRLLLEVVRKWWHLPAGDRQKLLSDPWAFKDFVTQIEVYYNQAAQQMLLHIVHPDTFEPVMSGKHKGLLAEHLATPEERSIADLDRRLLAIRTRMTPSRGLNFSFYEADLKPLWQFAPEPEDDDDEDAVGDEEIPDDTPTDAPRYWKVAPGPRGDQWNLCKTRGVICCGWNDFGDLTSVTREEFDAKAKQLIAAGKAKKGSRQAWTFGKAIKPGDYIIANRGTTQVLGVGRVSGPYHFDVNLVFAHLFSVDWYDTTPREVDEPGWRRTLVTLTREKFEALVGPPPGAQPEPMPAVTPDPAIEKPAPDDPLISLLLKRVNVVLNGPPGTGKTFASLRVTRAWKEWQGPDSVEQVTFHPSYAYEDFIEGFRPDETGKFTRRDGIFVKMRDRAHEHRKRKFLLVIDEMNRGDVARVLGELITLIERDKRRPEASRTLPYSQREFWVPPNLFLLGTMNTADRSISLLDVAIRRRFSFVEYPPDEEVITTSPDHFQEVVGVKLATLMTALNTRLQNIGVERDRAIGHAHFLLNKNGTDGLTELRERFRHDIVPLVEEYCYANRSQMAAVLGQIVREGLLDGSVVDDDEKFVKVLLKLCEPAV